VFSITLFSKTFSLFSITDALIAVGRTIGKRFLPWNALEDFAEDCDIGGKAAMKAE
jgi:hypothetical protein